MGHAPPDIVGMDDEGPGSSSQLPASTAHTHGHHDGQQSALNQQCSGELTSISANSSQESGVTYPLRLFFSIGQQFHLTQANRPELTLLWLGTLRLEEPRHVTRWIGE